MIRFGYKKQNLLVWCIMMMRKRIIKEAAPESIEILNYKVPCFKLVPAGKRDQQIMIAAYERFVGFYPFPTTMTEFYDELRDYKQGKGSVQFPLNKPLPKDLIIRMVRFRREEILKQAGNMK